QQILSLTDMHQISCVTFTPVFVTFIITNQDSVVSTDFAAQLVTPSITSVTPSSITAVSGETEIAVAGGPLISSRQIIIDGTPLLTTLGSMTVTVGAATGSVVLRTVTILVLLARISR